MTDTHPKSYFRPDIEGLRAIAIGAVAPTPLRCTAAEELLAGEPPGAERLAEAAAGLRWPPGIGGRIRQGRYGSACGVWSHHPEASEMPPYRSDSSISSTEVVGLLQAKPRQT